MSKTCQRCYKTVSRPCQSDTESATCPNLYHPKTNAVPALFVRTCQECGYLQAAKDPKTYKDVTAEAWRYVACKRCKSIALNYGSNNFEVVNNKIQAKKETHDQN